jgi:two-component system, sensor histidine kinase and response regulator
MPDMNGYELCQQLKADVVLKDIPVIFISALNETIDKVKAFRVGGVDYLTKPFQFEEVQARVETHLKIHRLQRQLLGHNEDLERLVAQRTHELAQAYERCRELGTLKDDFLRMISHEMRTPANGVLGIGTLLLDLCPASPDRELYGSLFQQSSLRLRNLIEDATMIALMEQQTMGNDAAVSFGQLMAEVSDSMPEIRISLEPLAMRETFCPKGNHPLLVRALKSIIMLSTYFCSNRQVVRMSGTITDRVLCIRLDMDALELSFEQSRDFFEIESTVRSGSIAESLGLAPVVAHRIISAFGGELRLVKEKGMNGYLDARFLQEGGQDENILLDPTRCRLA